jgi:hypothetical protein
MSSVIEDHLPYMSNGSQWPPVRTKRDFVLRYAENEFGNRAPTWNTLDEYLAANYNGGLIHLRNRIAGGKTWSNVAPNDVDLYWREALNSGLTPKDLYISGMCPTEKTVIQGEILQTTEGLNLYYTTVAKPMREALAQEAHNVVGLRALGTIKHYMDPGSYDWIQVLLERYPLHVIEFTTLSVNWGTIPHRNTLIWEVRGGY